MPLQSKIQNPKSKIQNPKSKIERHAFFFDTGFFVAGGLILDGSTVGDGFGGVDP